MNQLFLVWKQSGEAIVQFKVGCEISRYKFEACDRKEIREDVPGLNPHTI